MNNRQEANGAPLQKRNSGPTEDHSHAETVYAVPRSGPHINGNGHPAPPRIGFWEVLDLILRRWHWPVLGGIICAGLCFLLGWSRVHPKFTATAQLLRYDTPGGAGDFFKSSTISGDTFAGLLCSPELLRIVSDESLRQGLGFIPPARLARSIKVDPAADSDLVNVMLAAPDMRSAVDLLNLYCSNAVAFTRQLQSAQAGRAAKGYLQFQVSEIDKDIAALRTEFRGIGVSAEVTNKFAEVGTNLEALTQNLAANARPSALSAELTDRLSKATGQLEEMLTQYTEAHPNVIKQRSLVHNLQTQLDRESTNRAARAPAMVAAIPPEPAGTSLFNPDIEVIQIKLRALEDGRVQMESRAREAYAYAANPPGMVRVLAPATLATVKSNLRWFKIGVLCVFGGLLGFGASLALVLLVEFADGRLKTTDDVARVTGLPVLGTLNNLLQMRAEERSRWAFRTWIMLQGRLSRSANHGLVCGITSSAPGEGRSTWIRLLAEAASLAGFRVLTIATQPSPLHVASTDQVPEELPLEEPEKLQVPEGQTKALITSTVLSSPEQVTEQFAGPDSPPRVHIPLPGWVWNLERRKQWREALNHWRQIDNLVILVELPPASVAEAVLLGSNLPNLVWLTDGGTSRAVDTRVQLETLRHARCNLVGAILNREAAPSMRSRFPRWLG
ncbi:Polysaccharide export protein (fragment) [Verrucomicrobia bacterium]